MKPKVILDTYVIASLMTGVVAFTAYKLFEWFLKS